MFYSHQLLARKAPLGQIWMAATMHAKINRRKLNKLDIVKICEEILNPCVPMALRLSGILMGGVVIVYRRKVQLLYDDVSRFLIEINEAWKVKTVADRTVLPKGKTQAKYEAVTLPDNVEMEMEQSMLFSEAPSNTARFQRMRLDDLDDIIPGEDNFSQHHHQAEAANITLLDDFESGLAETDLYNRFERFDIEGEEETQINFTPEEHPQVPTTIIPSPPPQDAQDEPRQDDGNKIPQMEEQEEQHAQECRNVAHEAEEGTQRQKGRKRKARGKLTQLVMDSEQIVIPGNIYQSWLRDASDLVSKRGRKIKRFNPVLSTKISELMELPPVALVSGLDTLSGEVYYPAPLMELWRKVTQLKHVPVSTSGGKSPQPPQEPASHSPPEGLFHQDPPAFHAEDFMSETGPQKLQFSIEKLRANLENMDFQGVNDVLISDHFTPPGSSGHSARSIPSSGSGHNFMPMEPEIQLPSGRSKRRQQSSSGNSLGNLDPVEEEAPLQQNVRDFKMRRLSEDMPNVDLELLVETGPTQTPHPKLSQPPVDKITQSICMQLKVHFDTPGAPQFESLDQLASGMNRKKAAQLFYQTCVLATCGFVKVNQVVPYGDISISRGPKM